MQWKALGVLTTVGIFAGCGAAPPDDAGPEQVDVARSAAATCLSYTATLKDHQANGRVSEIDTQFFLWKLPAYYTTGGNELVGSSPTQTVTLYPRVGGGYTSNAANCQASTCGNGVVEAAEQCDGTEFSNGSQPECMQFGATPPYVSGTVKCKADCSYDLSGCVQAACGNGVVEGYEVCDGQDLGYTPTCHAVQSIYSGGQLKCKSDCTYDTSACTTLCGNGVLDPGEDCDGTARTAQYAGKTCTDFQTTYANWPFGVHVPLLPGPLGCTKWCTIDMTACKMPSGCYYVPIAGSQPGITIQCF